jgi:cell division protein FtsL
VWLLVLATLLGGLVFLNVAALRASMDVSRLSASAQAMQQANRGLTAQIATLAAPYRIDRKARQLGMVQQSPRPGDDLSLRPHRHAKARAFKR